MSNSFQQFEEYININVYDIQEIKNEISNIYEQIELNENTIGLTKQLIQNFSEILKKQNEEILSLKKEIKETQKEKTQQKIQPQNNPSVYQIIEELYPNRAFRIFD